MDNGSHPHENRTPTGVLRSVDSVTVNVPDLDTGLHFYRDRLGRTLLWRNDEIGQAGLQVPDGETELVLSTGLVSAVNWLVASVADAVNDVVAAGGAMVSAPADIPVGQVAVVRDPFGNELVLLDLSKGLYVTDGGDQVVGVHRTERKG